MPASLTSATDVVNAALVRIGKDSIGNLYDGSREAQLALAIYGQTRDEQLRLFDWGFAERSVSLAVLKTAPVGGYIPPKVWTPAYPPPNWIYEYAYPSDCLKVRALMRTAFIIPVFNPSPVIFEIANDNAMAPPAKVILCNIGSAQLVYTGRITDPNLWEADFTEALIAALARRLTPGLGDPKMLQAETQDEATETALADMRQG